MNEQEVFLIDCIIGTIIIKNTPHRIMNDEFIIDAMSDVIIDEYLETNELDYFHITDFIDVVLDQYAKKFISKDLMVEVLNYAK